MTSLQKTINIDKICLRELTSSNLVESTFIIDKRIIILGRKRFCRDKLSSDPITGREQRFVEGAGINLRAVAAAGAAPPLSLAPRLRPLRPRTPYFIL